MLELNEQTVQDLTNAFTDILLKEVRRMSARKQRVIPCKTGPITLDPVSGKLTVSVYLAK